jgi:uncharacterized membrane protein YkvA (DUF1232 family)
MIALWFRLKMLWAARRYLANLGRLFLDPRVSPGLKILTTLGALLIVSPVDVFGDIPVVGVLDDAALLGLLALLFVRFCPRDVVAQYFSPGPGGQLKKVN